VVRRSAEKEKSPYYYYRYRMPNGSRVQKLKGRFERHTKQTLESEKRLQTFVHAGYFATTNLLIAGRRNKEPSSNNNKE
jgi:hypothetical protein